MRYNKKRYAPVAQQCKDLYTLNKTWQSKARFWYHNSLLYRTTYTDPVDKSIYLHLFIYPEGTNDCTTLKFFNKHGFLCDLFQTI